MNKEKIYITGHICPDTDSIASAIGYSFLKNALGEKAVACRLGKVNPESKYLLNRFGFEEPMLLEDARVRLRDIEIEKPFHVHPDTTVFRTLQIMNEKNLKSIAVVDENGKLKGMVSTSDISKLGLGDTAFGIDLLKETPVECIRESISGKIIYNDTNVHLNGKVSIIALTRDKLASYEIKDRIVIVGNDSEAQKELIKKGAGMLVLVWDNIIEEDVIDLAKEYHCPIILSGHGGMNTSRYIYFSPQVKLIMKKNVISFYDSEFAEDVANKMVKYRFRSYPVINREKKLVGFVARHHMMNYKNKKLILVDHNEFAQSVYGVEKSELLEVVDHHRIYDFVTSRPVSFRNEIVGSTATIISTMFKENQIPIPQNLAGLLLGAVLSDTLKFQSPTTTKRDLDVANLLAAYAQLDIDEFAAEMFSVGLDIDNKSMDALINQDIKFYEMKDKHVMVSQVIIPYSNFVEGKEEEIKKEIETIVSINKLDACVVAFTSVLDNGSMFYAEGKSKNIIEEAFPNEEGETHSLQLGIVSRKKQIVPALLDAIY